MANEFSHLDEQGAARMVDVGGKPVSQRTAIARCEVRMSPKTMQLIEQQHIEKGDVLATARIAGISAAKQTSSLIPLCHPLPLTSVAIEFQAVEPDVLRIESTVKVTGQTGVEMEALTAVSVAALTLYDMCKAVDREMTIDAIRLEEKTGGASGHFVRKKEANS